MSLSQKNLSSIQKAGHAAHEASEALAATVRSQAESMVASMATAPFSVESEQAISRFKTLSKLSQGLATVEAELQSLFAIANDLASAASDVIVVRAITKRNTATNAVAVDVVAKPTKAAKKVKAEKGGRKAAVLTANDTKLLHFLQGALKPNEVTTMTGNAMAECSGLPLGSVGLSLKKIMATGAVKLMGRGAYQLDAGAAPVAAAEAAPVTKKVKAVRAEVVAVKEVKAKPAKRAKAPVAKKAVAVKAEVPAAKEVKAKPAKKAKAPVASRQSPVAKKAKPAAVEAPVAPVVEAPAVEAEAAPV
jgi:hypothetical protein